MERNAKFITDSLSVIASKNYKAKKYLSEVYSLLSNFFPIDTMHFPFTDTKSPTLTYKAFVINRNVLLLNEIVNLKGIAINFGTALIDNRFIVVNNSHHNATVREISNHYKVKAPISSFTSIIPIDNKGFVGFTFAAYGINRYQQEHIDLISLIIDPLSKTIEHLFEKIDKETRSAKAITSIHEVRELLEHQRIDLALNSQSGLKSVINQVDQVGPLESPVLITGETGVGKELIARMIHNVSNRSKKPFIPINCGALPDSLLDSELFGYEKGAFTGAGQTKAGYFEQADTGTLFLDEIGELSLQAQTKLLRVIQHQTFHRVGANKPVTIDVRVIAATNRDLPAMIKAKTFRQDLWYRLNVFPIEVPALRNRQSDLPVLVQYLINSKLYEMNLPFEPNLSPEAMGQLMDYDWPGNIRELQNVLERALILSNGKPLSFPELAPGRQKHTNDETSASFDEVRFLSMDEMAAKHIRLSLKLSNGKVGGPGGAAELLHMHPSTLRARMKKLNIKTRNTIAVLEGDL